MARSWSGSGLNIQIQIALKSNVLSIFIDQSIYISTITIFLKGEYYQTGFGLGYFFLSRVRYIFDGRIRCRFFFLIAGPNLDQLCTRIRINSTRIRINSTRILSTPLGSGSNPPGSGIQIETDCSVAAFAYFIFYVFFSTGRWSWSISRHCTGTIRRKKCLDQKYFKVASNALFRSILILYLVLI